MELSQKEERIAELHHALTMLDQEHDALRSEVDTKAELLDQLEQETKAKDGQIEEHKRRVRELESEVSRRRGDGERSREEIQHLRQQMELAQREIEELKTQLTKSGQHEVELRQDLSTMTQVGWNKTSTRHRNNHAYIYYSSMIATTAVIHTIEHCHRQTWAVVGEIPPSVFIYTVTHSLLSPGKPGNT